jgi:outer membrane protein TolC
MRQRYACALLVLTYWGSQAMVATAQEPVVRLAPSVAAMDKAADEAIPISPLVSPGAMSLDACIDLGYQYQPALAAARASLAAAQSGKRGLDKLIIPRLFRKDLPIRREQACLGVQIAGAVLSQAEWDARYAITRNFFTVQYIRSQQLVIDDVLQNLNTGYARAEKIFKSGDPNTKITKIDLDMILVQTELVNGKKAQTKNGMLKALAALREAMGLDYDYPLEIAAVPLPTAVYEVKKSEFVPVYKFNKQELIQSALANRGEMSQANAARLVVELEAEAQNKLRGYQGGTFAQGADIHVQPVPQGRSNGDYAPGAFSIEMPAVLSGRKPDRVQRARDLSDRAQAVVDKAHNLISLDVEAQFLKWQEAVEDIQGLQKIYGIAQQLPDQVLKLVQGKDLTGPAIVQANLVAINVRTQLNDQLHIHAIALAGLERATAGAFRVYPIPATPK